MQSSHMQVLADTSYSKIALSRFRFTQSKYFKCIYLISGPVEGCYYNFQHYGEGDRIMTNEPCLNCTCHNRMLMCYLRVCPFTKAIGQDCTVEKRADQCCPIVTCPDGMHFTFRIRFFPHYFIPVFDYILLNNVLMKSQT